MLDWVHIMVAQEHYKDLLRQAENERLIRQARARHRRPELYRRAMAWLGRRLVTWGASLQERAFDRQEFRPA
jgi:hypothetical protein